MSESDNRGDCGWVVVCVVVIWKVCGVSVGVVEALDGSDTMWENELKVLQQWQNENREIDCD